MSSIINEVKYLNDLFILKKIHRQCPTKIRPKKRGKN